MITASDLGLFIDGSWRRNSSRECVAVVNPVDGQPIAQLPLANAADLDEALAASARSYPLWRNTSAEERAAILHKAAKLLRARADAIGTLLTREQGKPIDQAKNEVLSSALMFDWYAEEVKRSQDRVLVRPSGQRSIVVHEPVGPVATFTPWNFPVYLLAKKVAAALAAGCTVISKPPEEAPSCTHALAQVLADAGLPAGVFQLVHGHPDMVSRHLIGSDIIRKISFTGSGTVGTHLMKLAADGMKRITLELGGHAPVLIFDDCDLERTLDLVVAQKFRNAGQVCVSPTRFFVEGGIYAAFTDGFAKRAAALKVGDGLDPDTDMGPLANSRRPPAIHRLVEDAKAKGARIITGGDLGDKDYFYHPTVLADVPFEAEAMRLEPFGPIALLRPFETFDEVIEQANGLPYGLAAFAFTENARRANLIGDALEAGMVGINTCAISVADAPFGGVKASGFGSEGGREGLENYQVVKAIHQA